MSSPVLPPPSQNLPIDILGVWWLLTREDWTSDGQKKIDPTLGSDPIGILTYAPGHFAAQFTKRDRSGSPVPALSTASPTPDPAPASITTPTSAASHSSIPLNNSSAIGGYDAYFGTYAIDLSTGKVGHTLIGSLSPANIGITVSRDLRVNNDRLMIQLETTTTMGELITRTLTFKRIS